MIVQRTITTTTTAKITTAQAVTGTVWQVMPPDSVILTLADGHNERFKIPNGQKFNINGQVTDAFGLLGRRLKSNQCQLDFEAGHHA